MRIIYNLINGTITYKDFEIMNDDLNHTCFYLDVDTNMCFSILQCKEQNIQQNNISDLQTKHLVLVGQLNLSLENTLSGSL